MFPGWDISLWPQSHECLTSHFWVESFIYSCFPYVYGAVFVVCSLLDQQGGVFATGLTQCIGEGKGEA